MTLQFASSSIKVTLKLITFQTLKSVFNVNLGLISLSLIRVIA